MSENVKKPTIKDALKVLNDNIDNVTKITGEAVDESKIKIDETPLNAAINKLNNLINDYKEFYGPKGRQLEVIVKIKKNHSADSFSESWVFNDLIKITQFIEIGTKGKYEK